jgi:ABC-type dipeptide/oligopeptide/nickel transport system permease subunit
VLDARARARFRSNRSAVAGAVVVVALVLFALLVPVLSPHGPLESNFPRGVGPDLMPVGPCAEFPLGVDRIFRDVLSRLAVAGRLSLVIAASATLIATGIGTVVGVVAGYYEGSGIKLPWLAGPSLNVDGLLMRVVDVLLAFPFLLLVMAIGASLDHTSSVTIFVTLGITGWLGIARVLRAKTMQVRALDYVVASRALGQSTPLVLVRHILPNIAGPLIVSSTVLLAQMIVADAVLSFLGVGIAPPTPTWGRMLFEGQSVIQTAPWLVAAPGAIIVMAVWGFNMLGEGLRDALDPRGV